MELALTESTNITVAVRQDFTVHSVKRSKACLVQQVCRDVYRSFDDTYVSIKLWNSECKLPSPKENSSWKWRLPHQNFREF